MVLRMALSAVIHLQMYNQITQYQQHLLQQPGIVLLENKMEQQITTQQHLMKVLHVFHAVSHGTLQHHHVTDALVAQEILMSAAAKLLKIVRRGFIHTESGLPGVTVLVVKELGIDHILQLEPALEQMLTVVLIQEL